MFDHNFDVCQLNGIVFDRRIVLENCNKMYNEPTNTVYIIVLPCEILIPILIMFTTSLH